MVARYHSDIKYWEVWNEFNGSFAEGGSPEMYAELVREASIAAKKIDPTAKIGMSVANFDVRFLDAAIKAGAASHFDYICVHPYEILAGLRDGGEPAFLNMTTTLRKMLDANKEPRDTPLWITEIGSLCAGEAGRSAGSGAGRRAREGLSAGDRGRLSAGILVRSAWPLLRQRHGPRAHSLRHDHASFL